MLLLQNDILEMVARGEPLTRTARALCLKVEGLVPGVVCSILSVDTEGRLHPVAGPSLPPGFSDAFDGLAVGPNVGSCGAAISLRHPIEAEDIETDPRWTAFKTLPLKIGLKACWSSPIIGKGGEVLGAFALYFRQSRRHTAREARVVQASTHLCAIALERDRHALDQFRLAYQDPLTELSNRAAFNEAIATPRSRLCGSLGLLILDLDNLKTMNDTFGHKAGDCLIQAAAACISTSAAPHRVFRLGGDEFAVLIEGEQACREVVESLARSILKHLAVPVTCEGHQTVPRATIGGAVAAAGETVEDLRQWADFALYHAKETLRGGFVAYSEDLGTTMTHRLCAIRDVGQALNEDRIDAYYQPIVRLDTGEIVGLEALFRVITSSGEVLAAGDYVEATSDVHTASRLTRRMLDIVARDIRSWLDLGIWFQHVGINAASADFQGGVLYAAIKEAFGREDVSLEHVILEVTESVYMAQDGRVAREIETLRQNGLRIALDDFGTGFASLTHLLSVPVDLIKIDKSFVSRMEPDGRSAAIVEGLIAIAARLGIRVVAEGVETRQHADMLEAFGCALAQGYLYSKAVDRKSVTRLLFARAQKRDPDLPMPPQSSVSTASGLETVSGEAASDPVRYAVLLCGSDWRVVSRQRQLGHFSTRAAAFQCALRLAREANAAGRIVELIHAEVGGELRAIRLVDVEVTQAANELLSHWGNVGDTAQPSARIQSGE